MSIVVWIFLCVWLLVLSGGAVAQQHVIVQLRRQLERKPWRGDRQTPVESSKKLICGCEHHFAFHDRRTGRCRYRVTRSEWNDVRHRHESIGSRICQCQGYTGTVPPRASDAVDGEVHGDVVVPLADGTTLAFPRSWSDATPGTEVVRWTPSP